MYGTQKNIKYNLTLFFFDGMLFTLASTLIAIATVIPFFLEYLGASTFQIAMAASLAFICTFTAQPFFGSIASRTRVMAKTFGWILVLQRTIFLIFALTIPIFAINPPLLVWVFLFFWGIFNIFVGSYSVFFTPILLKLLPPEKRGALRGIGFAIGSLLGVGMAALIPVIINRIVFPFNFVIIFSAGSVLLIIDATLFLLMREHEDVEPREPLSIIQYIKGIPSSVREDTLFRTMIILCTFLVVANALLPYYTLYAIRVFSATESHIATLTALAVISAAAGHIVFGIIVDRHGPVATTIIAACLVILAGASALTTNSLYFLYVAWVLANLGNTCYVITMSLLLDKVTSSGKLPLYVGVLTIISLALSSAVLLLLAPALERIGFTLLFVVVLVCGTASLAVNLLVFRRLLARRQAKLRLEEV